MPPGARSDGQWIVVWWFGGQWIGWVAGRWWWSVGYRWFCDFVRIISKLMENFWKQLILLQHLFEGDFTCSVGATALVLLLLPGFDFWRGELNTRLCLPPNLRFYYSNSRYQVSFCLWRIGPEIKYYKVPKYYDQD